MNGSLCSFLSLAYGFVLRNQKRYQLVQALVMWIKKLFYTEYSKSVHLEVTIVNLLEIIFEKHFECQVWAYRCQPKCPDCIQFLF